MRIEQQITFADIDPEYKAFVEKFKPKKTTDDCYTPEPVYNAIRDWVCREYGVEPGKIVRPFYPGGDYERYTYKDGDVVVDNPPFSIVSQICRFYQQYGIPFFIFAPHLTNFSSNAEGVCHIFADAKIVYENGATVNTAFLTNMDKALIRTVPDLRDAIIKAGQKGKKKAMPVYQYPPEVITATDLGNLVRYGVEYRVYPQECSFIRGLDNQRDKKKTIFGSGYLLSKKAVERREEAEKEARKKKAERAWLEGEGGCIVWNLSEREKRIVDMLE